MLLRVSACLLNVNPSSPVQAADKPHVREEVSCDMLQTYSSYYISLQPSNGSALLGVSRAETRLALLVCKLTTHV